MTHGKARDITYQTPRKLPHNAFVNTPPFSSSLGADYMTFSWHGHVSNKMAAKLRGTSALPSCMLCDDVSLCLGTIFTSSASLWHHLVVDSRVHHVQSCAYSWKHKRMWQTAEVSSKISNLASNRHVPLRAGTQKSSDRILARKRPKNTRTTAQLWCLWEHDKEYVVVLYTSKHYCTDRDNTGGPM